MKRLCFVLVLLIFAQAPCPLYADELPNWTQPPLYGSHGLGPITLEAGGSNPVGIVGCAGFINASQPDVNVQLDTAGPLELEVRSPGDTVLLVYTPEQKWLCADDVSDTALNPILTLPDAPAGEYNIWLGSAQANSAAQAELITRRAD